MPKVKATKRSAEQVDSPVDTKAAKSNVMSLSFDTFLKSVEASFDNLDNKIPVSQLPQDVALRIWGKQRVTLNDGKVLYKVLVKPEFESDVMVDASVIIPERHTGDVEESTHLVFRGQVRTQKGQMANKLLFFCVKNSKTEGGDEEENSKTEGGDEKENSKTEEGVQEGNASEENEEPGTSKTKASRPLEISSDEEEDPQVYCQGCASDESFSFCPVCGGPSDHEYQHGDSDHSVGSVYS